MIVIVLVIFLISEVPRLILNVWFFVQYFDDHIFNTKKIPAHYSAYMMIKYEYGMAWILAFVMFGRDFKNCFSITFFILF